MNNIEELQIALANALNKNKELQKDFDNYKQRVSKEKELSDIYQDEHLLKTIIPAIDNLWHLYNHNKHNIALKACAIEMFKCLQSVNISIIEPKHGDKFLEDVMDAKAITYNSKYKGLVDKCISPGYVIHKKIIKYPQVIVFS